MVARRSLILLIAAVLLAAGIFAWREHRRAERAEAQLGVDAARVLSAVFQRTSALRVARLSGEVLARSEGTSAYGMVANSQATRAPYTVDYEVDLRRLGPGAMRWDGVGRVMTVDVPGVTVARPNIDMGRARTAQSGLFISRSSGLAMQRAVAARLAGAASSKAGDAEHLAQAQQAARGAVEQLITAPLRAAGFTGVRVVVRLPGETKPAALSAERWDTSRPLSEILAQVQ